jgi:hypothetical protein
MGLEQRILDHQVMEISHFIGEQAVEFGSIEQVPFRHFDFFLQFLVPGMAIFPETVILLWRRHNAGFPLI